MNTLASHRQRGLEAIGGRREAGRELLIQGHTWPYTPGFTTPTRVSSEGETRSPASLKTDGEVARSSANMKGISQTATKAARVSRKMSQSQVISSLTCRFRFL